MDAEDPTTLAMLIKAIELKALTRAAPPTCGREDARCEAPVRADLSGGCEPGEAGPALSRASDSCRAGGRPCR